MAICGLTAAANSAARIDQLAHEGFAPHSVSGRAGLHNFLGRADDRAVFDPRRPIADYRARQREHLSKRAVTMGELFKGAGYATAIFGKWHLGAEPQSLPTAHGFDEFYGISPDISWGTPCTYVDTIFADTLDEGACKPPARWTTPDMRNSGPFRGGLGEATEGSIRTFCFIRWPGKVKPGTSSYAMFSIMDFFPTFARVIGSNVPADRPIDGVDQTDVLFWKTRPAAATAC